MTRFEIRRGDAADIAVLGPLWQELVAHHQDVMPRPELVRGEAESWERRRGEYDRWIAAGSGFPLIAEESGGGAALGYAFCRVLPGDGTLFDHGATRGELESLVVSDAARGTGVGSALIEAARTALKERGCTSWIVEVAATNPGAITVYERAGFTPWVTKMLGDL